MSSDLNHFRKRSRTLSFFLVFAVLLISGAFILSAYGEAKPLPAADGFKHPTRKMRSIAAVLTRLAAIQHYSGKKYNADVADMVFHDYLKLLDPYKIFFTRDDIANLEKYRTELSSALREGNLTFAFDAYNLLLVRMREYQAFADRFLAENPSIRTGEEYDLEHDKASYPANREEMEDLWRKKLLNDLIVITLSDRIESQNAAEEKKPAAEEKESVRKQSPAERIRMRVARTIKFYQEKEPIEVLELYLTSVVQVLDPHSSYMSPRTNENFDIDMSLSLIGIGAVLTSEDGYTKIVEIMPGSPAEKSGQLQAGDRIIAVRQEGGEKVDVIDMPLNKVVSMIRGEENTKVCLTVLKAGQGLSSPQQVEIIRKKIDLKDSAAHGEIRSWNGKRYGIIALPSFYMDFNAAKQGLPDYRSASNDVKKILLQFKKEHLDGIVIDLRSNGGGSLREAVLLTGLFIKEGPVVQVRGRDAMEIDNDEDDEILYDGPLAVMTNRFSASSSEIFAAAIRDYDRGVLTGDVRTHGKGTVQFISELDRYMPYFTGSHFPAGSIRLTNAKFYRINGESTQLKGVESDVPFPSFSDVMDTGEDTLDHAMPWDTISPTSFEKYTGPFALNDTLRAELRARSAKRIEASPEFKLLRSGVEEFRKMKDRKTAVLDIDKRWKEYEQQEEFRKEQERLLNPKQLRKTTSQPDADRHDVYLEETMNVLSDLIELSGTGK